MKRILFFPGFLGRKTDFSFVESNLRKLGAEIEIIGLDFFNKKSPHRLRSDQSHFMDSLLETVGLLKAENDEIYAVGYSLGGRVLSWLCEGHHPLFTNVAIISSFGGVLSAAERDERARNEAIWAKRFLDDDWDDLLRAWNAQPVFSGSKEIPRLEKDYDRELLSLAFTNYSPAHLGGIVASVLENRGSLLPTTKSFLRDRMLWMCGEKDNKYKNMYLQLESEGLMRFREVKNAGHRVIFDQPFTIADMLFHAWALGEQ